MCVRFIPLQNPFYESVSKMGFVVVIAVAAAVFSLAVSIPVFFAVRKLRISLTMKRCLFAVLVALFAFPVFIMLPFPNFFVVAATVFTGNLSELFEMYRVVWDQVCFGFGVALLSSLLLSLYVFPAADPVVSIKEEGTHGHPR